jgi:alcohol dehydrogenase (NADP+)
MKLNLQFLPLAVLTIAQPDGVDPLTFQPNDQIPVGPEEVFKPKPLTLDAIPLLGFGTWNLKTNTTEVVSLAIQQGYRHIDCAAAYGNEREVGRGISDGLVATGLRREDLWITSKLWNDQ